MSLHQAVDRQTLEVLADCDRYDEQVLKLRLQKLAYNFQVLRKQTRNADEATQARLADQLLDFQDRLVTIQLAIRKKAAAKAATGLSQSSSDATLGEEDKKELLDELNSLPAADEGGIRHRGKSGQDELAKAKISGADQLAIQETTQQELSENILEMVRDIRKNAELFSEKLAADSGVVDATGDALNNASSKMDSVGTKLNKYRRTSALGWWFYIKATVFITAALIIGMLLVQLMPKW